MQSGFNMQREYLPSIAGKQNIIGNDFAAQTQDQGTSTLLSLIDYQENELVPNNSKEMQPVVILKRLDRNSENMMVTAEESLYDAASTQKPGIQHKFDGRGRRCRKDGECSLCLAKFTNQYDLQIHMKKHAGKTVYTCNKCSAEFLYQCHLRVHMTVHTGKKPFKCGQCQAEFSYQCHLKAHIAKHTGDKPHKCDQCVREFNYYCHLLSHKKRVHEKGRFGQSDKDETRYGSKYNLKNRMKMFNGIKPYKCDQCVHEFSYQCQLKVHMRKHLGENPYKCDICRAEFNDSTLMENHRALHSEEKPYVCEECGAKFTSHSNLKIHQRKHTEEKRFKCDHCAANFSYQCSLKIHLKKHY